MKTIITRALPLNTKYILVDKMYIPLEQSGGAYCCDNCGKLIANIATVKNEAGKSFNIGFDCFETILINNSLLSTGDVLEYEAAKKMIPKILRFAKTVKETLLLNSNPITGLFFEKPVSVYSMEYHTFYWLHNNLHKSRNNDYVKLKDMNFNFLIETLRNIFPKMDILTDQLNQD